MSIAEIERRKQTLSEELAKEYTRHQTEVGRIREEYRQAQERANLLLAGLDEAKILHAEHVIYVHGLYEKAGDERSAAREEAIKLILDGGSGLMREYVGTKVYDRWYGQHTSHTYGMGPSHGSMIFTIGLLQPIRLRAATPPLTEDEIEAAVYYLRSLEKIQAAQQSAKAAGTALA